MSIIEEDLQELLELPGAPVFYYASSNEEVKPGIGNIQNEKCDEEEVEEVEEEEEEEADDEEERPHVTKNVIVSSEIPIMYQCTVCQKKFKTKAHIWYHEFCGQEDDIKPFKCDECGMGFVSKSHFQYHLRKHTGERPFVCGICEKGFSLKGKLNRHMISHKAHSCEDCDKSFANKEKLRQHMATTHKDDIVSFERSLKCKSCSKEFRNENNFRRHLLTHTDGKKLSSQVNNLGIGRNVCGDCGRRFKLLKDLHRHELIHTGEKPFSCDACDRKFARKDHLDRHVKVKHTEGNPITSESDDGKNKAGAPPVKKKKISKKSPTQYYRHPHVCKECDRDFRLLKDLLRHELIHSDEKPFSCDICNSKFRRKDNRDRHVKIHVDSPVIQNVKKETQIENAAQNSQVIIEEAPEEGNS